MEIVQIPVEQLHVDGNPREDLDARELNELTASIEANGILEPLRVVRNEQGYRIESGQRRWTAATAAGLREVPCVIIEHPGRSEELVAAVVTNVQRADLNPVDEAKAYLTLHYDHGLSTDGIAERVGVPRSRVTQRLDLLELPEPVVELMRTEKIPVSCRPALRAMQEVSPELAKDAAQFVKGKDEHCGVLAKEPMRVALALVDQKPRKYFAIPQRVDVDRLKLSKEAKEFAEARSSQYNAWSPRFRDDDADAAIAAGVAYRGKGADPQWVVVCDADWISDRVDVVVEAELKRIEERAAEQARYEAGQAAMGTGDQPSDEAAEREKQLRADEREARAQGKLLARNHNEELGIALLNKLVDLGDTAAVTVEMAWAMVWALIGPDLGNVFRSGLAVCLPEYFTVEQTKKGEKVVYETSVRACEDHAVDWLSRAKKPGEIVGRGLVMALACLYADQGVHPMSSEGKGAQALPRPLMGSQNPAFTGNNPGPSVLTHLEAVAKKALPKKLLVTRDARPSQKPLNELRAKLAEQASGS